MAIFYLVFESYTKIVVLFSIFFIIFINFQYLKKKHCNCSSRIGCPTSLGQVSSGEGESVLRGESGKFSFRTFYIVEKEAMPTLYNKIISEQLYSQVSGPKHSMIIPLISL